MGNVFAEDFEQGSNGAALTSTSTAFDSLPSQPVGSGAAATFDSSTTAHGGLSGKFSAPTSTATIVGADTFTAAATRYLRRYYRVSAVPASFTTLCRLRSGGTSGTSVAELRYNSTRQLVLRNGATTVGTTTTIIPVNTWMRVEWDVGVGASNIQQTLRLFLGANMDGATPDETLNLRAYSQGPFDTILDGAGAQFGGASGGIVWVDDVATDDAATPGPWTAPDKSAALTATGLALGSSLTGQKSAAAGLTGTAVALAAALTGSKRAAAPLTANLGLGAALTGRASKAGALTAGPLTLGATLDGHPAEPPRLADLAADPLTLGALLTGHATRRAQLAATGLAVDAALDGTATRSGHLEGELSLAAALQSATERHGDLTAPLHLAADFTGAPTLSADLTAAPLELGARLWGRQGGPRDITVAFGAPLTRWAFGQAVQRWAVGEAKQRWKVGAPR